MSKGVSKEKVPETEIIEREKERVCVCVCERQKMGVRDR